MFKTRRERAVVVGLGLIIVALLTSVPAHAQRFARYFLSEWSWVAGASCPMAGMAIDPVTREIVVAYECSVQGESTLGFHRFAPDVTDGTQ